MYADFYIASQVYKVEMERLEKKLRKTWRNEQLKPRRAHPLLTTILGLFIR